MRRGILLALLALLLCAAVPGCSCTEERVINEKPRPHRSEAPDVKSAPSNSDTPAPKSDTGA